MVSICWKVVFFYLSSFAALFMPIHFFFLPSESIEFPGTSLLFFQSRQAPASQFSRERERKRKQNKQASYAISLQSSNAKAELQDIKKPSQ